MSPAQGTSRLLISSCISLIFALACILTAGHFDRDSHRSSLWDHGPLPSPGTSALFEIDNVGAISRPDRKFVFTAELAAEPRPSTVTAERLPLPCNFLIVVKKGNRTVSHQIIIELAHSADAPAWHIATFSSDLFELPRGLSTIEVVNRGCRAGYDFVGGSASIGLVGDRLGTIFLARALYYLGLVTGLIGVVICCLFVIRRARAPATK